MQLQQGVSMLTFSIAVQKTMFEYTPKTDKIHDRAFAARGMKRLDSWHLLEVAIDPAYEGKGESLLSRR